MALAADADRSGRFSTLIPAMQTLGAAAGPSIAGLLVVADSFTPLFVFASVLWVLTAVLFTRAASLLAK